MSESESRLVEAGALAKEFGCSIETMDSFLARFAPRHTQADQFRTASEVMLFVHIPKTAGMSLGASLKQAFDKFHPVQWSDIHGSFRYHMRRALYLQTQKPVRQVLIGHFGWPELQFWRSQDLPLKCGTLFREPLARMVSNFNYNSSEAHPDHLTFRSRFPDLMSYAKQLPLDVQMTQAIGMVDSFDTALRRFVQHYSFLGVTEQLAAGLAQLARTHRLQRLSEERQNVAQIRPPEVLPAGLAKLVAEKSHNDAKLHRLLMRLYAGA